MSPAFKSFKPDLIVEVTSVCDRRCSGCYAPNVVSKNDAEALYKQSPSLFLTTEKLEVALKNNLHLQMSSIALRGGEPSRHPKLIELIKAVRAFSKSDVFVETHGRWILENTDSTLDLLKVCKDTDTILKISFDKMHGLKSEKLKDILDRISLHSVRYAIAITENSEIEFSVTRELCSFVPNDKIIYQPKATASQELIQPRLGVINVAGHLSRQVTSHLSQGAQDVEVAV